MLARLADLGIAAPRRVLAVAGLLLVLAAVYGELRGRPPVAPADSTIRTPPRARAGPPAARLPCRRRQPDPRGHARPPASTTSASARPGPRRGQAPSQARRTPARSQSYWTAPEDQAAALRSSDGRFRTRGRPGRRRRQPGPQARRRHHRAADRLARRRHRASAAGIGNAFQQVNDQTKDDLAKAESIAIPLTVIALIWVFGSFVAALLPLVVGLSAIIGTMAILRGLAASPTCRSTRST